MNPTVIASICEIFYWLFKIRRPSFCSRWMDPLQVVAHQPHFRAVRARWRRSLSHLQKAQEIRTRTTSSSRGAQDDTNEPPLRRRQSSDNTHQLNDSNKTTARERTSSPSLQYCTFSSVLRPRCELVCDVPACATFRFPLSNASASSNHGPH